MDGNLEAAADPVTLPLRPSPTDQGDCRVLLVEDDAGDAFLFRELLEREWPAVRLCHATSLADAESMLGPEIDCVVLDLSLPDVSGLDALTRIRRRAPETAVVVLTGNRDGNRALEALQGGAQDYITKDAIDSQSLVRAIGYSVQRKHSERSARELAVLRVQTEANARVHRGLAPHLQLEDPRVEVASTYQPGNRRQILGGDFFDIVQTSPHCVHAVLGDVCGRGPDEAVLGIQLRIAWRTLTLAEIDQHRLLELLDRVIARERHADHVYATLASVRLDLEDGTMSVASAGHPPPVLLADGRVAPLLQRPSGPPVGMWREATWSVEERTLAPGSTLLLYSDGVYEGRANGQRLGIDGFVELLGTGPADRASWETWPEALVEEVEALNGGPLDDDVALLGLRFHGGGG